MSNESESSKPQNPISESIAVEIAQKKRTAFVVFLSMFISTMFFIVAGMLFYSWVRLSLEDIRSDLNRSLGELTKDYDDVIGQLLVNTTALEAIQLHLIRLRELRVEERETEIARREKVARDIALISERLTAGIERQGMVYDLMLRFLSEAQREELKNLKLPEKLPDVPVEVIQEEKL